jgi:hypothetical protein
VIEHHSLNGIRRGISPYAKSISITRLNACAAIGRQISVPGSRTDVLKQYIIGLNNDAAITNLNARVRSGLSKYRDVRILNSNSGEKVDVSANLKDTGTRTAGQ